MFAKLAPLMKDKNLNLLLSLNANGVMTVSVMPMPKMGSDDDKSDKQNEVLKQPLALSGKPEELDEEFLETLTKYQGIITAGKNNLEQIQDNIKMAEEEAKKLSKSKKTTPGKSTTPPSKPQAEPAVKTPSLFDDDGVSSKPSDGTETPEIPESDNPDKE
jgi:PRTRC genetic system protein E